MRSPFLLRPCVRRWSQACSSCRRGPQRAAVKLPFTRKTLRQGSLYRPRRAARRPNAACSCAASPTARNCCATAAGRSFRSISRASSSIFRTDCLAVADQTSKASTGARSRRAALRADGARRQARPGGPHGDVDRHADRCLDLPRMGGQCRPARFPRAHRPLAVRARAAARARSARAATACSIFRSRRSNWRTRPA